MTLIEITIALTIVSTAMMASAGAFFSSISTAQSAQRRTRATVFLETVMEDLSAQPYDNLLAFDGNTIFDQPNAARANFAANVTVFEASLELLQVQVVLTDVRSNRVMGRLVTQRSER
jgi:type II secretory pathway pseudopilin PulG